MLKSLFKITSLSILLTGLFFSLSCSLTYSKTTDPSVEKTLIIQLNHTPYTIHYFQWGENHAKHTIYLLHGLLGSKEQWSTFANILQQAILIKNTDKDDYNIIAFDLPGYGSNAIGDDFIYQINTQIQALKEIIQHLSPQATSISLIGNSMGGLIVTLYANTYPNKIKNLTLMGSPSGILPFYQTVSHYNQRLNQNFFLPLTKKDFDFELQNLLVNYQPLLDFYDANPQLRHIALQKYAFNYAQYYHIISMLNSPQYLYALRASMNNIVQNVLIFWGNDDQIFGPPHQTGKKIEYTFHNLTFKNAKTFHYITIPNAGHLLMLENSSILQQIAHQYVQNL